MHACRYLRQIAVITPYAEFKFTYTAEDQKSSMKTTFTRRTDKMPAPPKVHTEQIKAHYIVSRACTYASYETPAGGLDSCLCDTHYCQLRTLMEGQAAISNAISAKPG